MWHLYLDGHNSPWSRSPVKYATESLLKSVREEVRLKDQRNKHSDENAEHEFSHCAPDTLAAEINGSKRAGGQKPTRSVMFGQHWAQTAGTPQD